MEATEFEVPSDVVARMLWQALFYVFSQTERGLPLQQRFPRKRISCIGFSIIIC